MARKTLTYRPPKGYPKAVKKGGRKLYRRRKGGRTYTGKQLRAMFWSAGWKKPLTKRRRRS